MRYPRAFPFGFTLCGPLREPIVHTEGVFQGGRLQTLGRRTFNAVTLAAPSGQSVFGFRFADFGAANLGQFAEFEKGLAGPCAGRFITFFGKLGVFFDVSGESFGDLVGCCRHVILRT